VNRRSPRKLAQGAIRLVLGIIVSYVLGGIAHGLRYRKSQHIPRTGPAIVIANHLAVTDGAVLSRMIMKHRRYPRFLIMGEVFDVPVVGKALLYCGQIPVRRGSTAAVAALAPAQKALDQGKVVVMYPEGKVSGEPDLRPGRGQHGAAKLALDNPDVPVIPVGVWGPRPGKRHVWHRHTAHMLVGAPVDLSPWHGVGGQRATRDATAAMMAAITALVEQVRGRPFDAR
jgi:1-acyl-sn-glycerol-3-phosphate acyltransferase